MVPRHSPGKSYSIPHDKERGPLEGGANSGFEGRGKDTAIAHLERSRSAKPGYREDQALRKLRQGHRT